jgi:N-acetylmuramoyl-L-alanine amidase
MQIIACDLRAARLALWSALSNAPKRVASYQSETIVMKFDTSGWLDSATRTLSPNKAPGPNAREIIVMHYTAGYTASSAVNTFLQAASQASAHFVVDVDGGITQMVSTADVAWHAGKSLYHGRNRTNTFAIGIEIVNPGYHFRSDDGTYLNWENKPISAAKLAPFPGMVEAHDDWVGSRKTYWPNFPEAQLKALDQLTKALLKAYKSISDIVGHRDVDVIRHLKVDPGPAFPMKRYRLLLDGRDDADTLSSEFMVKSADGTLNVRGGPGTNFDKLSWGPLENGQHVLRIEARGEWYHVRRWIDGVAKDGWVFAANLVPV